MKIAVIGGGPGGLFTAILARKAFPDCEVDVYERNRAGDTFGWGVVFSDETLGNVEAADPESFAEIRAEFAYWTDIETFVGDEMVRSTGHGFCGLARRTLLEILDRRARAVGVRMHYETEVSREVLEREADLVVASDGINSQVRREGQEHFGESIDWRACRFSWLGTNKPLSAFTFIFRENDHGVWNIHAYPFERGEEPLSTWIVECTEETWRRAGLEDASEEDTVAYVRELFGDHLDGYDLLTNRSIWRVFPTVRCEDWVDGKTVLLGDSAHTAHFSIGSGTKLAMEDSIALVDALVAEADQRGEVDVKRALSRFQESRHVEVVKTQKAAQISLEWFENSGRYLGQDPTRFTFNLMTRSKRITYDNLALRDPELVERTRIRFAEEEGLDPGDVPAPAFAPLALRDVTLANRIVVSPMCQYSAEDGVPNRWHDVHYGARAIGGAGLLWTEATNVSAEGRITHGCTGIWSEEQEARWKEIVEFAHENSAARVGLQLGHAGRKASYSLPWEGDAPLTDGTAWEAIGPTGRPFLEGAPAPRAMTRTDMERVIEEFVSATERAERAGFDLVEIHAAHGYLLSSFLSAAVNDRDDGYGGERFEDRARFPLEVLDAVRAAWPAGKPLFVRVSATDWLEQGGQTVEDSVAFARMAKARGCDAIDVSSAGNVPESRPVYGRMYQVPFAERIRYEAGIKVQCVGALQGIDHANTVLAAGRADLVAMARPHLEDPHLTLRAANELRVSGQFWPRQYVAARRR
ncbi:MAG: FAD-dependent monooxygenase [Planctomycetota bacterium]|nr:FAD-dependent monooxygenase [Planctomycetota bacterium]MEC8511739.1 FAD-dependent monooxygenase [Planctomycetota bacterium]